MGFDIPVVSVVSNYMFDHKNLSACLAKVWFCNSHEVFASEPRMATAIEICSMLTV